MQPKKQSEKRPEKRKHDTSTPEQPEKCRKSARLTGLQGGLEKPQASTSQAIEIEDEQSAETEAKEESSEETEQSVETETKEEGSFIIAGSMSSSTS